MLWLQILLKKQSSLTGCINQNWYKLETHINAKKIICYSKLIINLLKAMQRLLHKITYFV